MWFLFLLTFLNAIAHNSGFVLRYRITVGGMPVSIFEALLGVGLLVALVARRNAVPTYRVHPAMTWTLVLFAAGTFAGMLGALISNAELRWMLTGMRNWVVLPISILIGYCLILAPRACTRFSYVQVWAGVATSVVILLFFHSRAAVDTTGDVNRLRAIAYVSNYAGLAGTLLLFALISNIRMFPAWLTLGMAGFCFIGQFATLTRSDWLATMAGVGAIYVLLPSYRPRGKLIAAVVGPPLVAAFLWLGLIFASTVAGRDFEAKVINRVYSMLPGQHQGVTAKAWDTRLEGIQKEMQIWARSPIIGGGFGATDVLRYRRFEIAGYAYRHNAWTSTLAESGIIGFAAISCMVGGMIVAGRRLARDSRDKGYVLIGALGVITGVHYLFHGLATQSFNQMRWGIPLAIVCGVVLRARAMQLTEARLLQEQYYASDAYGAGYGDGAAEAGWHGGGYDYAADELAADGGYR